MEYPMPDSAPEKSAVVTGASSGSALFADRSPLGLRFSSSCATRRPLRGPRGKDFEGPGAKLRYRRDLQKESDLVRVEKGPRNQPGVRVLVNTPALAGSGRSRSRPSKNPGPNSAEHHFGDAPHSRCFPALLSEMDERDRQYRLRFGHSTRFRLARSTAAQGLCAETSAAAFRTSWRDWREGPGRPFRHDSNEIWDASGVSLSALDRTPS